MSSTDRLTSSGPRSTGTTTTSRRAVDSSPGHDLLKELTGVSMAELEGELARVANDEQPRDGFDSGRQYSVRSGDTLSQIARDHGVSLDELVAANPQIRNPDLIHPGDQVNLPNGAQSNYAVKSGDTLSHIARDHGVSLSDLLSANPQIQNPDRIYPGDWINIPNGAGPNAEGGQYTPVGADGVMARGMAGPEVADLQRRLNELGFGAGTADGQFGPITQGAVRRFQMQNDLNTTGRADAETLARLNSPEARRYETSGTNMPNLEVYPPGSPEQVALFEEAARRIGVPESWARDPGLINILRRESGGRVGVPNYTYGPRARDPSQWGSVHEELRNGRKTARSSATGLGQLLLSNVDRYYPSGRAGIGVPVEEAAGMLAYIRDRYGSPGVAWSRYNTAHEGY